MNNFIVPVDFSETSTNAARFAAHLSAQVDDAHIILFNVFDKIEAGTDGTPLDSDDEERKSLMGLALQSVKNELSGLTFARITCITVQDNHFVDALDSYVRKNDIQLIIMGITGATRMGQIFMGSNTLNVVNRRIAPVIIVPPEAEYTGIKNVMFITDLKDVHITIPVAPIKEVLNLLKPSLHIVNVDHEHYVELTEEYKAERAKLDKMFQEYRPEYYFIRLYDFMDAINQFVTDKNIDMILTVPKNHSFLTNVFKTTHTSKLAYHSHVPIVAIHS
ncbi:MAG TPA: universal stress protein [Puia sp.]|nr:universal stress protein [Puia sp.]